MKRFVILCVAALLLVASSLPTSAKGKDKSSSKDKTDGNYCLRYVALVNSGGVNGVEDQSPFFTVPSVVYLSDTTSSDTILTSTPVWIRQPLWRVTQGHESRIDLEGPLSLTCITLAPFHDPQAPFSTTYRMQTRIDDTPAQSILLATTRSNPLYTTRLPGWSFGRPQGYEVLVPAGKHSVYFKVGDAPFDFVYAIFQVTRQPKDIPTEEPKKWSSK